MDDNLWEVQGIDADLRRRAVQEAARRGLSLTAYLTDVLRAGAAPARDLQPPSRRRPPDSTRAAAETAEAALLDIRNAVASLSKATEAAHATLERRIEAVSASVETLEAGQQALRQAVASDFSDFAAETAAQIDARLAAAAQAGADQEERIAALIRRVAAQDEAAGRTAAALIDRIAETERALKSSHQALASAQRKSAAATTAELAKVSYDTQCSIDALRDQHGADRARLNLLDQGLDRTAGEVALLRAALDEGLARATEHQAQVQRHLTRVNADWDSRFDALAARIARVEQESERSRDVLSADAERIEACTLAALQKLHADITSVRSASAAFDGEARARFESIAIAHGDISERLAMLEHAASRADSEQAHAIIRSQIAALAEAQRLADQRLQDVAGSRADAEAASAGDTFSAVEEQLTRLEQRQANALDMLREQIALMARENEQRLVSLESSTEAGRDADMLAFRLARLEQRDAEADLNALRNRLEARMQELEARSVRAVEQLSASISELERKMLSDAPDLTVKSA